MLEYVFFDEEPRQRFQAFLDQNGLPWSLEPGDPETRVVVDDVQLDEALAERLESLYDELFGLGPGLHVAQSKKNATDRRGTGLLVHLKDGSSVHVDLPQELVNRVLAVISQEELDIIADAIVCAVDDLERPVPS